MVCQNKRNDHRHRGGTRKQKPIKTIIGHRPYRFYHTPPRPPPTLITLTQELTNTQTVPNIPPVKCSVDNIANETQRSTNSEALCDNKQQTSQLNIPDKISSKIPDLLNTPVTKDSEHVHELANERPLKNDEYNNLSNKISIPLKSQKRNTTIDESDALNNDASIVTNIANRLSNPTKHEEGPTKQQTNHQNNTNFIRTMIVNFQSIEPKLAEFWHLIADLKPDVILGTETWLKPEISNSEIFPPDLNYKVFRKDRRDGYGGVLIATKDDLITNEMTDISQDPNIVFVKINTPKNIKPLVVCSVYRTPSDRSLEAALNITNSLDILDKNDLLWIGGDFNLPDIDWKNEQIVGSQNPAAVNTAFIDKARDLGLTQINETPTRGKNILDLFFTNRPGLVTNTFTVPGLSDHDIVVTDNKIRPNKIKTVPHLISIWNKANISKIRDETEKFSSNLISSGKSKVDEMWTDIESHLKCMMDLYVPTKMSSKRFHQPWITTKLKRLSRKKKKAWTKYKRTNSSSDSEKYKQIKRETQRENRQAHQNYVKSMITDSSTKKLWKFIKNRKCDESGVAPLVRSGVTYSKNQEQANILNEQFCSVFTTENNSELPKINAKTVPDIPDITITEEGLKKLLDDLNPTKAAGPDKIPSRLLKLVATELAPALTKFFQSSIDTGVIPSVWKHATVQPIFKKGDKSSPSNYRPISLTCICCKLLEHIVRSSISNHLESNGLISNMQHGFRKGRSCDTQLVSLIQDIASVLDKGGQVDAILLDFSKAFDKVPHRRLLHKLASCGIRGKILLWIKEFLNSRTQQVVVNGEMSKEGLVTSGVPQGSVLGPILFLAYINDIEENISSNIRLFADDTILYKTIENDGDACTLDADLKTLQSWESKWLMEFNPSKCSVITFTNKKAPIVSHYTLHGHTLEHVQSAKYLGVELTKNLKWNKHIDNITSKANKIGAFIWRNLKGCPITTQVNCYKTLVRPILEYANVVWDPHQSVNIKKIEKVQTRCVRRIMGDFSPRTSSTFLVKSLNLEDLQSRRKNNKAKLMFKILNNISQVSLPPNVKPTNSKTRGHSKKLQIPPSRVDAHLHSFFPSSIRIWNNLSAALVQENTFEAFSKRLSC